ncbi:50S ribosomal protein L7ae-like protein [Clostridium cellulovorans]|uniref:Ribosomal protein L7Ae/L30e/S12e/Gadd45 n=1 Tax=Clostridium cellulovorans (strain ATCC 35296 / DSM 3052 / OCM 3 / 743B) TaxID=573061 RepID=D9SKN5_CLOC7|nr:50S ribosomal protein L7ae-like protein [Clostridium cellulovorans]ADL51531.1 ribosomal protein L7Ae/L30e/S12e/Gadd45 [Clostridium cellulovorans 743B]
MVNKFYNFLGLVKRSGNLIEGYNRCDEAIKYKKLPLILMSKDVSDNTKKKFLNYSSKSAIKILEGFEKEDLGRAIGRAEIKIVGILDGNMAKKLLELYGCQDEV